MEGSHYFYIVSLILCFFLRVNCFGLQELFEGWDHIELHQIENCLPVFLNPKMEIITTQDILLFRLILCDIVLFSGATYAIALFMDYYFCVSNIYSDSLRTLYV